MPNLGTPEIKGSGRWVAISPSNSVDLPDGITRAIYVGGAGNIVADSENGETSVTFTGLLAGMIYPLRVKRVRSTSTTATLLVALYTLLFVVMVWGSHGFVV